MARRLRPTTSPSRVQPSPSLREVASHSHRSRTPGLQDNLLIHGDNLPVLEALERDFAGKIRCVYLDPPFNTGRDLGHYDDDLAPDEWREQLGARLRVIHRLLSDDGTLFVHIDDHELGPLLGLLDELFGRANRASIVTFKQGAPTGHKAINQGCVTTSNFVLIYARDRKHWRPNRLYTRRDRDLRYTRFVLHRDQPPSRWRLVSLWRAFADAHRLSEIEAKRLARRDPAALDRFVLDHAHAVARLARPSLDAISAEARALALASRADPTRIFHLPRERFDDFYFLRGERILFYASKLRTIDGELAAGEPLTTIWDDLLSNNLHHEGGVAFPRSKKPEALLRRVIELSTRPGDWVLDAFAGSGTTGAVAHKLGRRWILVERGDHCTSLIAPRLRAVVEGTDLHGITATVGWTGGGGFRYLRLAPSAAKKATTSRARSARLAPAAR